MCKDEQATSKNCLIYKILMEKNPQTNELRKKEHF